MTVKYASQDEEITKLRQLLEEGSGLRQRLLTTNLELVAELFALKARVVELEAAIGVSHDQ